MLYALNLTSPHDSPDRSTKSTPSRFVRAPAACKHRVSGSLSLPSRGPFHLSFTVLCSIGHWVVFSLTEWSPLVPAGFLVSRSTLDPVCWNSCFGYRAFTFSGRPSQAVLLQDSHAFDSPNPAALLPRFGLFPFRSPLLGKSMFLSLPLPT